MIRMFNPDKVIEAIWSISEDSDRMLVFGSAVLDMANRPISSRHNAMSAAAFSMHVNPARWIMVHKIPSNVDINPVCEGDAIDILGFLPFWRWAWIHTGIHSLIVSARAFFELVACLVHARFYENLCFRLAAIEHGSSMRCELLPYTRFGLSFPLPNFLARLAGRLILGVFTGMDRGDHIEGPARS